MAVLALPRRVRFLRTLERLLLFLFVAAKCTVFSMTLGKGQGFDWGPHIEMLHTLSWKHPFADMHTIFYGYHPPLAFLTARLLMLLGFPDVIAVQSINLLATIVAFLLLRETLKELRMLWKPATIVFLYGSAAIPIQVFLSYSINMEATLLALAAAILYCSVRLFWHTPWQPHPRHPWTVRFGLIVALALAMLTKFNAILLFAIPPLTAITGCAWTGIHRRTIHATMLASAAVLMILPYYVMRYYIPEGTFFPSNTNTFDAIPQKEARAARDRDPLGFLVKLFGPSPVHAMTPAFRDLEQPRLFDTWKDLWVRDDWLVPSRGISRELSIAYLTMVPWVLLLGSLAMLKRTRRWTTWDRLGMLLGLLALLHVLFLVVYLYRNPWGGSLSNKGIYIAPASWFIAYLLASTLHAKKFLPKRLHRYTKHLDLLAIGATAILLTVNHLLPVY